MISSKFIPVPPLKKALPLVVRTALMILFVLVIASGRGQQGGNDLAATMRAHIERVDQHADELKVAEFAAGKDWFNSPPLRFSNELRGKVVILDFWTYCCINCIHILPDLAELERKYAGFPVAFIGVHSAKFENEKDSRQIRNAVLRYEIEHPVINDDEMNLWRAIGVRAWPSMAVVGPKGNLLLMVSGEGKKDLIDTCIQQALKFYPPEVFRYDPIPIALERDKSENALTETGLRFPAKLAFDDSGERLFISDSNHNRILITSPDGAFIDAIGSGRIGLQDGSYGQARFNRPQGIDFHKGLLYVADAENHALRQIDPESRSVKTLAGDGVQGRDYNGGAGGAAQQLSTPWDVLGYEDTIFIAMAGTHQIWKWDLNAATASRFSGDGSEQNLNASDPAKVAWAQPSGLALVNNKLYVADSESSTIRALDIVSRAADPVVGGQSDEPRNLFDFGHRDGIGDDAALQHPLGVIRIPGQSDILVADTYNHRIRLVNPSERSIKTLAGGDSGYRDGSLDEARFSEPSGFAIHPVTGLVYVADTNNHCIRIMDLKAGTVTTLGLKNIPDPLEPYAPEELTLTGFAGLDVSRLDPVKIPLAGLPESTTLTFPIRVPDGYKINPLTESLWKIRQLMPDSDATGAGQGLSDISAAVPETTTTSGSIDPENATIKLIFQKSSLTTRSAFLLEGVVYYCESGTDKDGLCKVGHFQVPVHFTNDNPTDSENKNPPGFPVTIKDMTDSIHNTADRLGFPF